MKKIYLPALAIAILSGCHVNRTSHNQLQTDTCHIVSSAGHTHVACTTHVDILDNLVIDNPVIIIDDSISHRRTTIRGDLISRHRTASAGMTIHADADSVSFETTSASLTATDDTSIAGHPLTPSHFIIPIAVLLILAFLIKKFY